MKKLKIGDVFSIQIADGQFAYGQILYVRVKNQYLIAVYEGKYSETNLPDVETIVKNKVLFMGNTLDALFFHGWWKVVGNAIHNIENIPKPYFKLGAEPNILVTNYKGEILHKASQAESDMLPYMSVVAPIRFDKAVKAFYKLLPWEETFDKLLFSNIETQNNTAFHI